MNRYLVLLLAATLLIVGGCATSEEAAGPQDRSSTSPGQIDDVLTRHRLDRLSPVGLVNRLDRLAIETRPGELTASVLPDELVLTARGEERSLDLPADRFYLSVAPYGTNTHDCFHHSLTTCTGELADTQLRIKVIDRASGKVLVDQQRSTFANGFVGLWLPRDIEATLRITSKLGQGSVEISTAADAPTCLTTLKLT